MPSNYGDGDLAAIEAAIASADATAAGSGEFIDTVECGVCGTEIDPDNGEPIEPPDTAELPGDPAAGLQAIPAMPGGPMAM